MFKDMDLKENYIIKIGMCDDDIESIKGVSKILESEIIKQELNAEITLITDNQKVVFDAVYKRQIDVLFLDIDFKGKGKNGLDFARDLREINKEFFLIFLSGHQRYMHVSFFAKVFDYLIKPINRDLIEEIVGRIKDEFKTNKKLFLRVNKWVSVRMDDIIYIERTDNKSYIITANDKHATSKSLDALLNELPRNFKKCHRSFILNENKVVYLDKKNRCVYFSKKLSCPINSYFDM